MTKRQSLITVIVFISILIAVFIFCRAHFQKTSPISYSKSREVLGTVVTITLYGDGTSLTDENLTHITNMLFDEAEKLENIFSAKLAESELSYVNSSARLFPVTVSDDLFAVFDIALKYCRLSDGALDISIGNLTNLWNIGSDSPHLPSDEELTPLIGLSNWKNIVLDYNAKTVSYTAENICVDLGAVAKGYVGDMLKKLALDSGIQHGILNLGGNIVTIGNRYDDTAWNIGITNPLNPGEIITSVKGIDVCVVTSGNYERYFSENGIRYHHILNADTGFPSESGVSGVTIIGASSACCDALSTACFILGIDKGLELIENCAGYEAVFIDNEGRLTFSSGMEQYYEH